MSGDRVFEPPKPPGEGRSRFTYGSDVGTTTENLVPADTTQQTPQGGDTSGSRATYGGDVQDTTKPITGQDTTTRDPFYTPPADGGQSRPEYGGDVDETTRPITGDNPDQGNGGLFPEGRWGQNNQQGANPWDGQLQTPGAAEAREEQRRTATNGQGRPGGSPTNSFLEQVTGIEGLTKAMHNNAPDASIFTRIPAAALGGAAAPLGNRALSWTGETLISSTTAADGTVSSMTGRNWRNRFGHTLRNNYNPARWGEVDRIVRGTDFSKADDALARVLAQDGDELARLVAKGSNIGDDALRLADLNRRTEMLGKIGLNQVGSSQHVVRGADKLDDVVARGATLLDDARGLNSMAKPGTQLFTKAEIAQWEARQLALSEHAGRVGARTTFETPGLRQRVFGAIGLTLGSEGITGVDGFIRDVDGLGFSMVDSDQTVGTQKGLVPAALAFAVRNNGKLHWGKAGLYATAALASGHVIDYADQATGGAIGAIAPDSWKRTTAWDAGALGTAFMVGAKNPRARAALVAGAWVVGNMFESADPFANRTTAELMADADQSMARDNSARSLRTMNAAFDDYKEVASISVANEGVIFQRWGAYRNSDFTGRWRNGQLTNEQKLQSLRESAILARVMGENRMEKGTKVMKDGGSNQYILGDHQMDVGGYALEKLFDARRSVDKAKQMTEYLGSYDHDNDPSTPNIAATVFGTQIDAERENRDLEAFGEQIDEDIRTILGAHDRNGDGRSDGTNIEGAFEDLVHAFNNGIDRRDFMRTFIQDIPSHVHKVLNDANNPPYKRVFVAKLLRDEALARMAWAAGNLDGNIVDAIGVRTMLEGSAAGERDLVRGAPDGTAKGYDGALGALENAIKLDPNHPDNQKLVELYERIRAEAEPKINQQMRSATTNGLNVDDGLYDPRYR